MFNYKQKYLCLQTLLLLLFSNFVSAEGKVLLTGKIVAGDTQNFSVPWSQTWRQQIKWMKPEGETVETGELVVLFDTSNLDSQIEQEEVTLRQSKDKALKSRLDLEQKLINAEHDLIKTKLELKLAKFLNDVPARFRSGFEQDTIQFDLKKSIKLFQQNQIKLKTAQDSLVAENKKQQLEIDRIASILAKKQKEIDLLQLKADRKGTVLHAMHPWDGSKISEGQSVQSSWAVASIPGAGDESVQAWVNEVDWPKLKLNQSVKLILDAYPESSFKGEIIKISFQAESKKEWGIATYYEVAIKITEASKQTLIPGMSVLVELSDSGQDEQTLVLDKSHQLDQEGN